MIQLEFHGTPKSGYDRKVRSIASQAAQCDDLIAAEGWIRYDINLIPRANTAIASAIYVTRWTNRYTKDEALEIWREGQKRVKIVTLRVLKPIR